MKDLPPTPSGLPLMGPDLGRASQSEHDPKFNKKEVRRVDGRSSAPDLVREPESGGRTSDIRKRDAEHSSDTESCYSQSVDSTGTASSVLTDYEADFADFAAEETTLNGEIRRPGEDFPVPVDTDGAKITISNSGAAKPVVTDGASITIEGGGQVSKGAIKSLVKRLWSWAVDFAKNHKIAIGLALSILLVFVMASPAGPAIVGATAATILASLGAVAACALIGALIVDMIASLWFQPQSPSPAPRPNQNPQNPQTGTVDQNQQSRQAPEPGSQSEPATKQVLPESSSASGKPGKAESADAFRRQKSGSLAEADGQFFLTPSDEMSCVVGGEGTEPVQASSTGAAGQAKPFSMEVFNRWLAENFAQWASRRQYGEFSKHPHKSDSDQALDTDGMLDSYLQKLGQKSSDLAILASSPLKEPIGSADLQQYNLQRFAGTFASALEMLNPTPEHCRTMLTELMGVLPREEFPWVSSDLWAPLLSVGEGRKSLEGFSRDEMARVEASDFLRLSLRILERFANQRGAELANPDGNKAELIVGGAVASDEEVDSGTPSTLRRFERLPGLEGVDTQLPDTPGNRVKFEAFFTNIIIAVVQWNGRPGGQSDEEKIARTREHHQKLVVNSLARGMFEAGFRMMRDMPEAIKIDTASGRQIFLRNLFASPEVDKIFVDINAQEYEQAIAREYVSGFIK